jgi:hypothetical protein
MGGSTLLFPRFVKSLHSYETDKEWYDLTQKRISQIPDKVIEPKLHLFYKSKLPDDIPKCELMFIDGLNKLRTKWFRKFWSKSMVILFHDSRRMRDVKQTLNVITKDDIFFGIKSIYLHYKDSNMILIKRLEKPVKYYNWSEVEKDDNRVDPSIENYVVKLK